MKEKVVSETLLAFLYFGPAHYADEFSWTDLGRLLGKGIWTSGNGARRPPGGVSGRIRPEGDKKGLEASS